MTKDEIKKALECCSNPSINFCKDCPYNNNGEFSCCDGEMCKDALNLITEQEQEIERLRTTLGQCNTELNSALESLKSQCREIGELKAENEELTKVVSSKVYDLIDNAKEIADAREEWEKQAKIDVLNELKAKSYVNDYCREVVELEKIDELIKEAQND